MPRSIRDVLKRQAAQALNNQAKAILDINAIYEEFKEVHPKKADVLAGIIISTANQREALLLFVADAWELDEDHIMNWLA